MTPNCWEIFETCWKCQISHTSKCLDWDFWRLIMRKKKRKLCADKESVMIFGWKQVKRNLVCRSFWKKAAVSASRLRAVLRVLGWGSRVHDDRNDCNDDSSVTQKAIRSRPRGPNGDMVLSIETFCDLSVSDCKCVFLKWERHIKKGESCQNEWKCPNPNWQRYCNKFCVVGNAEETKWRVWTQLCRTLSLLHTCPGPRVQSTSDCQ